MNVMTAVNPLAVPGGCPNSYFNDFSYGYCPASFGDEESLGMPGKVLFGGGGGGEVTGGGYDGTHSDGMQMFEAGIADDLSGCLDLGPEWLAEPISLPTPDQPGADIIFSPQHSPFTPDTSSFASPGPSPQSSMAEPFPTLLTPDSSYPSSPQSSYYSDDPEINNVMCSLLEEEEPYHLSPNATLPLSPTSLPLQLSTATSFGSSDNIRDLLLLRNPELSGDTFAPQSSPSSRKRKSPSGQPSGKRRLNQSVKKERKRAQNKAAALKYRQRKKGEMVGVEGRREILEEQNSILRSEVEAMANEIQYLKRLWRDVCEAKERRRS